VFSFSFATLVMVYGVNCDCSTIWHQRYFQHDLLPGSNRVSTNDSIDIMVQIVCVLNSWVVFLLVGCYEVVWVALPTSRNAEAGVLFFWKHQSTSRESMGRISSRLCRFGPTPNEGQSMIRLVVPLHELGIRPTVT